MKNKIYKTKWDITIRKDLIEDRLCTFIHIRKWGKVGLIMIPNKYKINDITNGIHKILDKLDGK